MTTNPKHTQSDGREYEIGYCNNCNQMTNHLDDVCQKCKDASQSNASELEDFEKFVSNMTSRGVIVEYIQEDGKQYATAKLKEHFAEYVQRYIKSYVDQVAREAVIKELTGFSKYDHMVSVSLIKERLSKFEGEDA